jgi:hypothetical protein
LLAQHWEVSTRRFGAKHEHTYGVNMKRIMKRNFDLLESNKVGLNFELKGIFVRGRTVFLRVLGNESSCAIVTATAGENGGRFVACRDQARLIEGASQTRLNLGGGAPVILEDESGRPFVHICSVTETEDVWMVADAFFAVYDQSKTPETAAASETRELYDALSVDGSGDGVYLGDGVWIGSDGSVNDRGR